MNNKSVTTIEAVVFLFIAIIIAVLSVFYLAYFIHI
jgi:hypothetical protein